MKIFDKTCRDSKKKEKLTKMIYNNNFLHENVY